MKPVGGDPPPKKDLAVSSQGGGVKNPGAEGENMAASLRGGHGTVAMRERPSGRAMRGEGG